MKKMSVLVTSGVVAALSFGFQSAASAAPTGPTAWPTGCTYQNNFDNGAMARCDNSNGGHYRASVICIRQDGGGKIDLEAVAWRTSGWSKVYCPALTIFYKAGIVTKSS